MPLTVRIHKTAYDMRNWFKEKTEKVSIAVEEEDEDRVLLDVLENHGIEPKTQYEVYVGDEKKLTPYDALTCISTITHDTIHMVPIRASKKHRTTAVTVENENVKRLRKVDEASVPNFGELWIADGVKTVTNVKGPKATPSSEEKQRQENALKELHEYNKRMVLKYCGEEVVKELGL